MSDAQAAFAALCRAHSLDLLLHAWDEAHSHSVPRSVSGRAFLARLSLRVETMPDPRTLTPNEARILLELATRRRRTPGPGV